MSVEDTKVEVLTEVLKKIPPDHVVRVAERIAPYLTLNQIKALVYAAK